MGYCPHGGTDYSQSPVNFSTTVAAQPPDNDFFFFKYPAYEAPVEMINDGRYLYARLPTDNDEIGCFSFGLSYPDHLTVEYTIYKIMVHTPSEHTYNGKKVPLEVQLFHRKKDAELTNGEPDVDDLAIVAVGYQESRDEASPFLRALIDGGLPDQKGGTTMVNRGTPSRLDFAELFRPVFGAQGEKSGFFDYTGSLTQPPCTTGVRWLVKQEAMNAKKETLKLFTNSVRKSSNGVPGNNRGLQIMGPRPVFPRFARNAIQIQVFDPDEPAAYKDAMARAKKSQADFKKAIKVDEAGSRAAMEAGMTADQIVLASNDYKTCMNEQCTLVERFEMADMKKKAECNKMKGAQETVHSIAGGPARIEAATVAASMAKSCEDQGRVAQALEGQKGAQMAQCEKIKSRIIKRVEAERKAAAAKAAAEKASEAKA